MALNIHSEQIDHNIDQFGNFEIVDSSKIDFNIDNAQRNSEPNSLLSSVQRYELEWHDFSIIAEDPCLKHLRKVCTDGHLKVSKFRSVCWALLLKVLRGNSRAWQQQRREHRLKYQDLKETFMLNPHKIINTEDHPLSQSLHSIWHQFSCDKELMAVIRQDVVRTFPGVEFFRQSNIQEMMIMILFCYAREYPEICYRQGMHEILAPVLFVLHSDHQALLHISELTKPNEILREVLSPKHMEEDAYFIFSKIMTAVEPYYRVHNIVPSSSGYFPVAPPPSPDESNQSELEVVAELNYIRDKILAKEDLHLHNHLLKLDIPLPIFGIRWLRLLFGREFQLQELLILWDAIFADGDAFELTNYIVVAMLIRIRDKLLVGDYTTCLTYLMKYPGSADVSLIIRHAMYMKSPSLYKRPDGAFVYVNNVPPKFDFIPERAKTLPRNGSSIRMAKSNRPHTSSHDETKVKLSSLTSPDAMQQLQFKEEKLQTRITNIQTTTALATIKLAANSNIPTEQQSMGVQDGYVENSPEVLKMQLQNSQTVMSISRLKLSQYLTTLRKYIPSHSPEEVNQALDGMEELCALLKTKFSTPYSLPVPVDLAFEADEAGNQIKRKQISGKPNPPNSLPINNTIPIRTTIRNEHQAKAQFVQQLKNGSKSFEISAFEDFAIDLKSSRNYSAGTQSSSDSDSDRQDVQRTRYEIPDEQIGRIAVKILGDRKELEMHELMSKLKSNEDRDLLLVPNADPSGERETDSPD